MRPLWVVLALAAGSSAPAQEPPPSQEPTYPLGPQRFPELTEPGHPFVLTDLRYRVVEEGSLTQDFGARVRLGAWAILGAFVEDQRRGLNVTTHRLELGLSEQDGQYAFSGGFRAPRFLVQGGAQQRRPGTAWLVDGDLALRFSNSFELLAGFFRNTEQGGPRNRPLDGFSAGFLYQRGPELELSGLWLHDESATDFGTRETDNWSLSGGGVILGSLLDGSGGYERSQGRFPRNEGFIEAGVQVPVLPHVLALVRQGFAWEPGIERFERETRVGVSFHGRRIHLTRVGEAARRTYELARQANELGLNARQAYDLDGRRALRERLALSPQRLELREAIEALYRAQVDDRNVINASIEVVNATHEVRGTDSRTYRASLGIPWSPAWPWSRNEGFTGFLRATYTRGRIIYANGFEQLNQDASLEASLNREMLLALRWRKPGLTPLDVTRSSGRATALELEYSYIFGR
jgi:hypothetical protein